MKNLLTIIFGILLLNVSYADKESDNPYQGIKFRSIGPALMSGRIADIAIDPTNENIWYVGVGSGGVWKTINSGTTWTPVFDDQDVYSIGSVALDPSDSNRVWVGTGENVGGRHVSFGDGIYLSENGGKTWTNKGLKKSEHISTIVIHPENSNTLWVAVQGPLWSKGGERGLYKTTDGGESWKQVLGDDEWVGATDVVMDPRNPDRLYAATWQRHRNVAAYMGGGPGTAIYRSEDGGENWVKLTEGLPNSNMGKIGLAISPQKPDEIYAAIELDRRTGGIYKSWNRGAQWQKQSDAVAGATGPHYYQELYASPHVYDRIYLMNSRVIMSDDGGKTHRTMNEKNKHPDNHAMAFKKNDTNYVLMGTDGGLYESFDDTSSWKFIANLPVTQFYKLAVDDAEPFYHVYGGTQDNNTQRGPVQTDNLQGIRNSDWTVVLFGDGHQPATEPGNPDIVYAEWQQGNLVRYDNTTGELVYIQPQAAAGEVPERFNWDAPILVSPHDPKRLYFASQRVWRSDDRGDSWVAISGDLTKNEERLTLPIMGGQQSWDNPWDLLAMSQYNTITSLAESPLQSGLVYVGTDDGIIQVTNDGGKTWGKTEVGDLPGVPDTAFVNDIKADLFDRNTVYVALDNHKFGDYKPYLLVSRNQGKTWRSISEGLPDNHLVWRLVQDHVDKNLMFVGTEFGLFASQNAGASWHPIKAGLPTIAVRDLAIQKRESDLVLATFGRGFYVLDDYSRLRDHSDHTLKSAQLFPVKDAWWYIPRVALGFNTKASQGDAFYQADNPPFGAVINYYLPEGLSSKKAQRKKSEKAKAKEKQGIAFPGWDDLDAELAEKDSKIWLIIKNQAGDVVRRLSGPATKGYNQVAWDLRYPAMGVVTDKGGFFSDEPQGMMVGPGEYQVSISQWHQGELKELAGPMKFNVKPMRKGALEGASPTAVAAFWKELSHVMHELAVTNKRSAKLKERVKGMHQALARSQSEPGTLDRELHALNEKLNQLNQRYNGSPSKQQVGEIGPPTISDQLGAAFIGTGLSTYGPTPNHRAVLDLAKAELDNMKKDVDDLTDALNVLSEKIDQHAAPWVPN